MSKIFSYYVSNGTVKIKIQETSQSLSIMHISVLDKLFADVDLSPTVRFQQYDNSIAITRGEVRVSAASGMDNIYQLEAVRYCHRKLSLGSSGYPDSTSGHYTVTHVMFQFFTSSFCLLLATSNLFSASI